MIVVTFNIEGCSKRAADDWAELVLDACRLEPRIAMSIAGVDEISSHLSEGTTVTLTGPEGEALRSAVQGDHFNPLLMKSAMRKLAAE